MVGWEPALDIVEERLGSLGARGKKRSGIQVGPSSYTVWGDAKLGDAFDKYEVRQTGSTYHCSCQEHRGGEYRRLCSHISYVIMAKRGIVEWAGEYRESKPREDVSLLDDRGSHPLPLFVDQGQEWTDGVREALNAYFGDTPPLPEWIRFIRSHQWDAFCDAIYHLDSGKKVVFLSAPTGSGKTLIGDMVRRAYAKTARHNTQALYTCTTKTLQDQFEHDFWYGKVIKGRANYPTAKFPHVEWIACDLCEAKKRTDSCQYCGSPSNCPYVIARDQAEIAPLAVANVAYLLAEGNTAHSRFAGRGLVIVDEADSLEDELMRYVEITISPRMQKLLGLKPPEKKTVPESWEEWRRTEALPKVRLKLDSLVHASEPREVRLRSTLDRLLAKLEAATLASEDEDAWVYTGYDSDVITFKPVRVDAAAPLVLWPLGHQWLLMSATIISAQQMAEDLGLADDEWALVEVPSTFPAENRPIYVEPVANMTAKTEQAERPRLLQRINQIAEWHDERILVHTVSYRLSTYLVDNLGPRAITYRSAKERESALERFRASENGILVAPSFERGIDLPYDECRVVVVAKVPFPYLGDKQVSKRLYSRGGQGWYAMQTVRSLVQMSGRAMRHADDRCEVYVLDKNFISNIWKKSRHLLPEWWKEALVMKGSPNLAAVRSSGLS